MYGWPTVRIGWTSATDAYYYMVVITTPASTTPLVSERIDAVLIDGGVEVPTSVTDGFPTDGTLVTFTVYAQNSSGSGPSASQTKGYDPKAVAVIPNFAYTIDSANTTLSFSWGAPTGLASGSLAYNVYGLDASGNSIGGLLFSNSQPLGISCSTSQFVDSLSLSSAAVYFVVSATDSFSRKVASSPTIGPYTTPVNPAASTIKKYSGYLVDPRDQSKSPNLSTLSVDTTTLAVKGFLEVGTSVDTTFQNNNPATVNGDSMVFVLTYYPGTATNTTKISVTSQWMSGSAGVGGDLPLIAN